MYVHILCSYLPSSSTTEMHFNHCTSKWWLSIGNEPAFGIHDDQMKQKNRTKKNRREKLWQKVQLNPTWLQKVRSETINLISDNKTNYFYLKWENNKKISYWIAEIISDSNCMFFQMNHLYRTNKPNPGIWISMGRKRGERKEVNDERIAHNRMRMTQR